MSRPILSAVIPIRLVGSDVSTLRRLAGVVAQFPAGMEAVVVDDSASAQLRAAVADTLARCPRARHLPNPETADQPFSIGQLRDVGTHAARADRVLFHDVDFTAPPRFYEALLDCVATPWIRDDPTNTLCVPVFFLTRWGTRFYRLQPRRAWCGLARGPGVANRLLVDRLVRGSSAILADRGKLLDLGGHDPAFQGHGAEDFELLHRLSKLHPRGARPTNYSVDFGSRSERSDGFRAYFARYGQPLLDRRLAMVHLWHPRRRQDPRYYALRRQNFEMLARALEDERSAQSGAA